MRTCDVVDCEERGKQYKYGVWVCDEHYVAIQRGAELEVADDAPDASEPDAPDTGEPPDAEAEDN